LDKPDRFLIFPRLDMAPPPAQASQLTVIGAACQQKSNFLASLILKEQALCAPGKTGQAASSGQCRGKNFRPGKFRQGPLFAGPLTRKPPYLFKPLTPYRRAGSLFGARGGSL